LTLPRTLPQKQKALDLVGNQGPSMKYTGFFALCRCARDFDSTADAAELRQNELLDDVLIRL
jgi:hypothetical protein